MSDSKGDGPLIRGGVLVSREARARGIDEKPLNKIIE